MGGNKNLLSGGRGCIVFWLLLWSTLWVWKPRTVAKNYSLYRGSNSNFANEECYIISAVSKILKSFVHKEIRSRMVLRILDGSVQIEGKAVVGLLIFAFRGNLFSSSEVLWIFTERQRYCCCSTHWLWQISAVYVRTHFKPLETFQ